MAGSSHDYIPFLSQRCRNKMNDLARTPTNASNLQIQYNTLFYKDKIALWRTTANRRERWFKGWMQTWAVHMRQPFALAQALGFAGFATFQLVVGGTVLAALVHPVFIAMLLYGAFAGRILPEAGDLAALIFFSLFGATLAAGYLTSAALGLIGLARRGLIGSAWVLLLMPLHWLLLSLAAWRALYQLVRDPYRWEKTAHGLARTSRLAAEAGTARVKIFRNSGADIAPTRSRPSASAG
jgi:cellulose synthase/poly-beta-1,6-N-acetylglucosamine synthase-like glycosyltransferase